MLAATKEFRVPGLILGTEGRSSGMLGRRGGERGGSQGENDEEKRARQRRGEKKAMRGMVGRWKRGKSVGTTKKDAGEKMR